MPLYMVVSLSVCANTLLDVQTWCWTVGGWGWNIVKCWTSNIV